MTALLDNAVRRLSEFRYLLAFNCSNKKIATAN
jgi:hypothetical protein